VCAVGGAQYDRVAHAFGVGLRERQRHHAAIRRADTGLKALDAEVVEQRDQDRAWSNALIVGRLRLWHSSMAAAEEIEAEDP